MSDTLPLTGGSGQPKWTIAEGITELKREAHMRQRVYPGLVARGQLEQGEADRQNRRLQGTIRFLEFCAKNEVRLRGLLEEHES
jgi:hypothetical protein